MNIIYILGILICSLLIFLVLFKINYVESFENKLLPNFRGGLGNNLFQLSAAYGLARQYNKNFKINMDYIEHGGHGNNADYFKSIFKNLRQFITDDLATETIREDDSTTTDYALIGSKSADIRMEGYFQNIAYITPIREEFIKLLSFNEHIASKYDKLKQSMFIHLRGGDYKSSAMHNVDLTNYYARAIEFCKNKGVQHYYIFTNDTDYANSQPFLKDISHNFVNENEVDSLYLMSQCQLGGIGANSSFSWWGLYLNIHRPYLILPDKWYNDGNIYTDGFYFNNSIKMSVT
jgi:hypothetical protein